MNAGPDKLQGLSEPANLLFSFIDHAKAQAENVAHDDDHGN